MICSVHNSLIVTLPQITQVIIGELSFLFLIHFASLCRNVVAGRDVL